jgi:hypothetical protein
LLKLFGCFPRATHAEQDFSQQFMGRLHRERKGDRTRHSIFERSCLSEQRDALGQSASRELDQAVHLLLHYGVELLVEPCLGGDLASQKARRFFRPGEVAKDRSAHSHGEHLVDIVERRLSFHLCPAARLDHVSGSHRGKQPHAPAFR